MTLLLLDKYIIISFIKKLLNILSVFVTIFLVVEVIEDIDNILDHSVGFSDASMLYIYSIPQYISIAFPMAILISTVMTFTIFQKNNELTAFKASGISIYRLTIPFIIIGLISSIGMFYFENLIVTESSILKYEQERKHFKRGNKKQVNNNILVQLDQNRIISIEKFDHRTNIAKNISIQEFNQNTMLTRLDAEKMKWEEGYWNANKIKYRIFNEKNSYSTVSDSSLKININPIDLTEINTNPQEMNYWALKSFISRLKNNGREFKKWLVDLHFKTAFSFSNILMVLFGISLSIQKPRSNLLTGVGSSIFIIFIYYVMIKSGQTMGYKGVLSPFLSVWSANILFLISGIYLLYKTRT